MIRLVLFLALIASPVHAQGRNCGLTTAVEASLIGKYHEVVVDDVTKIAPRGNVKVHWRVWRNEKKGNWTFTGSRNGITCLFGHGMNYGGWTVDDFLLGGSI